MGKPINRLLLKQESKNILAKVAWVNWNKKPKTSAKKAAATQLKNPIKANKIKEKSKFKWYTLSKIKQGKAKNTTKFKNVVACFCIKALRGMLSLAIKVKKWAEIKI